MTDEPLDEHHEATLYADRAVSFARTAELYERARPPYPQVLLDTVFERIGGGPDQRILDLGAGTGKLTRQLLRYGTVSAVEPLDEMRALLERVVPQVPAFAGTAESIPLPDGMADVIAVGQAFHWFDQPKSNPEIARMLADGGHLLMIWNHEVPSETAVQMQMIMSRGFPSDTGKWDHKWAVQFTSAPWFTEPELFEQRWTLSTTKSDLLARCESVSSLSVRPPAEREPLLREIEELVAKFPDPFDVEYNTQAYLSRKRPIDPS